MFDASGREIHPDLDTNDRPTDPIARWCFTHGDESDIDDPPSPTFTEQSHFVARSASGYGSLRGFRNSSVFSYDFGTPRPELRVPLASQPFTEEPRLPVLCPTCHRDVKTQSEFKKHLVRHKKPFKCDVLDCPRTDGFSTTNDLDRYKKSRHPQHYVEPPYVRRYSCTVVGCRSKDKTWHRLDNFRSHLKGVHHNEFGDDEQVDEAIRR